MASRISWASAAALTSVILAATVAVAVWMLAVPGDRTAQANHALVLAMDMVPESSPANTATSLGSTEACRDVNLNDTFPAHITISGVDDLVSWETYVRYDPSIVEILAPDATTTDDARYMFQQAQANSILISTTEGLPDTFKPGEYRVGAADISLETPPGDTGSGILLDLQFKAVGTGFSFIYIDKFDNPPLGQLGPWMVDINGNPINNSDSDPFGLLDSTVLNGLVVVGGAGGACADTDLDGIPDSFDNCTNTPNPLQENNVHPITPEGDHCEDPDSDAVFDINDNCPDTANGPAEASIPGVGNQTDTDGDGLGDACDSDEDNDGYTCSTEEWIGTNCFDNCGEPDAGLNYSLSWPTDLFSGAGSVNLFNIQDVTSFVAPVRRFNTSPGDLDFHVRWDLAPGKGPFPEDTNIQDITALVTGDRGNPPMFGGERALNYGPCVP